MRSNRRFEGAFHALLLAGLVTAGLVTAGLGPAIANDQERSFILDGRDIVVPVPAPYCPADRSDPRMAMILDAIDGALPKEARMLTADFDCDALAALQAGASGAVPPYVAHVVLLQGTGDVILFVGSRASFLEGVAAAWAGEDEQARAATRAEMRSRTQQALDELNRSAGSNVALGETQAYPGLAQDDVGAYIGFIMKIDGDIGSHTIAGVAALTLVRNVAMMVAVYREHDGGDTFDRLLTEAQSIALKLIEANEGEL